MEEEEVEEGPEIDEETGQYDHENNENDVILNIVEGSDPDEEMNLNMSYHVWKQSPDTYG